jgi:hypothetical protein
MSNFETKQLMRNEIAIVYQEMLPDQFCAARQNAEHETHNTPILRITAARKK